jgi:hypothetical protein
MFNKFAPALAVADAPFEAEPDADFEGAESPLFADGFWLCGEPLADAFV